MADIKQFIPLLLKWEGGYVNNPADRGGSTNKGVTLATWQQQGYDKNDDGAIDVEDLKLISTEDVVERILRPHYWNRWQADRIDSQALANILVDWVWNSGRYGITIPQGVLGVTEDGIVGEKTLWRLNNYPDPEGLFEKIKQMRRAFFNMICIHRPENKRFLKGWLNRLNDFKWIPMVVVFCALLSCRTTQKTEMLNEKQTVETSQATSLRAEQKDYTEQGEHLLKDQNEVRSTETLTAVFDTLNSGIFLKELRISKTISDRVVHTDQTAERRTVEIETLNEEQAAETLQTTSLQTELKEKPVRKTSIWWIIGGIAILLSLTLWIIMFKKIL